MINQQKKRRILRNQTIGFFALIGIAWLDVSMDLSHRVFGGDIHTTWQEGVLRTAGIVAVWIIVYASTRSILTHLYQVEKFARLCSGCRNVGDDAGQWRSFAEHFSINRNSDPSRGLCPVCQEKLHYHDRLLAETGHNRR